MVASCIQNRKFVLKVTISSYDSCSWIHAEFRHCSFYNVNNDKKGKKGLHMMKDLIEGQKNASLDLRADNTNTTMHWRLWNIWNLSMKHQSPTRLQPKFQVKETRFPRLEAWYLDRGWGDDWYFKRDMQALGAKYTLVNSKSALDCRTSARPSLPWLVSNRLRAWDFE